MRYQLSDPLSDVFDKIEDLERMGDAIKVPYSEEFRVFDSEATFSGIDGEPTPGVGELHRVAQSSPL